jgi:hypothetical protein
MAVKPPHSPPLSPGCWVTWMVLGLSNEYWEYGSGGQKLPQVLMSLLCARKCARHRQSVQLGFKICGNISLRRWYKLQAMAVFRGSHSVTSIRIAKNQSNLYANITGDWCFSNSPATELTPDTLQTLFCCPGSYQHPKLSGQLENTHRSPWVCPTELETLTSPSPLSTYQQKHTALHVAYQFVVLMVHSRDTTEPLRVRFSPISYSFSLNPTLWLV